MPRGNHRTDERAGEHAASSWELRLPTANLRLCLPHSDTSVVPTDFNPTPSRAGQSPSQLALDSLAVHIPTASLGWDRQPASSPQAHRGSACSRAWAPVAPRAWKAAPPPTISQSHSLVNACLKCHPGHKVLSPLRSLSHCPYLRPAQRSYWRLMSWDMISNLPTAPGGTVAPLWGPGASRCLPLPSAHG